MILHSTNERKPFVRRMTGNRKRTEYPRETFDQILPNIWKPPCVPPYREVLPEAGDQPSLKRARDCFPIWQWIATEKRAFSHNPTETTKATLPPLMTAAATKIARVLPT